METIGFNSKIFVCGLIAIGRLNAFEGVNNWTVRLADLNHFCNRRSSGADRSMYRSWRAR
jgi:hypothetical protein